MSRTLNVSPETLKRTSNQFEQTGTQVQNLTSNMTETVNSISDAVWQGEAANKYKNKFNRLNDDIKRMINMIREHVNDLNTMASNYDANEKESLSEIDSLSEDVIV